MALRMAISKAGHDKGKCYVVVREEPNCLYLADGESRTVSTPKKKNIKHVQIIKRIPSEILDVFNDTGSPTDTEIKRAVKLYHLTGEQQ